MPTAGAWADFLRDSDAEMRKNDMNRGLTFTPDTNGLTLDVVAEYTQGFAWCGVGAREVIAAVGRDERGVKRALAKLVEDGRLRVVETPTRGPRASKRKVYYSDTERVIEGLDDEMEAHYGDRLANKHGAGGGRAIRPLVTV